MVRFPRIKGLTGPSDALCQLSKSDNRKELFVYRVTVYEGQQPSCVLVLGELYLPVSYCKRVVLVLGSTS